MIIFTTITDIISNLLYLVAALATSFLSYFLIPKIYRNASYTENMRSIKNIILLTFALVILTSVSKNSLNRFLAEVWKGNSESLKRWQIVVNTILSNIPIALAGFVIIFLVFKIAYEETQEWWKLSLITLGAVVVILFLILTQNSLTKF